MDPNPQDMPDMMGRHDPLGDAITVALVVVTLFGALIGWQQVNAVFKHDEAAVRAEEWTVLASSQHSRANQAEQLQLGRLRQVRRNKIGAEQAAARAVFGRGDRTLLALEAGQWRQRVRRVGLESRRLAHESAAELREIEAGAVTAFPDIDPSLGKTAPCVAQPRPQPALASLGAISSRSPPPPISAVADMQREAYRMEGLRDGAAETAVQAEEQFTRYAASLAVIAVALFFFGYALTKYGFRFRRIFAAIAGVLTLFSAFLAINAFSGAPPKPRPAAAAAYADGRIAFRGGHFQTALEDFACATRLNAGFGEAFLQRSLAFDQRGMPRDVAVINESLANRGNVWKALKYGRQARRLDPEDPLALAQIATSLYIYGVTDHDRRDLSRALTLDQQIAGDTPRDPIPAFNAATALLALGRPWQEGYRRAEQLMDEASQPLEYVGGVLTDLDYLQASDLRPGIAATAKAAKEQVVAAVSGRTTGGSGADAPGGGNRASLRRIHLRVTPASVYLSFAAKGFTSSRSQLFAALYRHQRLGWQELPHLSGPVSNLAPPVHGQYGTVIWSTSPSTSCLGGGTYKVELYVNGQLANVGHASGATVDLPKLKPHLLRGMNLSLCDPSRRDWQRISRPTTGLFDGFERRNSGAREGIAVFDVSQSPARGARQIATALLGRFSPPLPSGAEQPGSPSSTGLVGNLAAATTMTYTYPHGIMVLTTATTPIGRRLAIAVFGPRSLFTPPSGSSPSVAQSMLDSLSSYDIAPFQG